jgi:hypothetical protein
MIYEREVLLRSRHLSRGSVALDRLVCETARYCSGGDSRTFACLNLDRCRRIVLNGWQLKKNSTQESLDGDIPDPSGDR